MALEERDGQVTVWLWLDADGRAFETYLREQYEDEERPLSPFAEDLGIGFCDHDDLESAHGDRPRAIGDLLDGCSYFEDFGAAAVAAARRRRITTAHGFLLLFGHRWSGRWTSQAPVRLLGTFALTEEPEPPGPERRPDDHRGRVTVAVVSSDGRLGVTAARGGELALWDLEEGTRLARGAGPHKEWVHDVAFTADGRLVSVGSEVACWTRDGDRLAVRVLGARGGYQMLNVCIDPDDPGAALAVCVDRTLTRWRLDGKGGEVLLTAAGRLTGLRPGRDGVLILQVDETGVLAVQRGVTRWSVAPAPGAYDALAVAADVVVQARPEGAVAFDVAGGARVAEVETVASRMVGRRDRRWVAMGTQAGEVHVWDLSGPPIVADAHRGPVGALAVAAEADRLLTVGRDGTVALWTSDLAPVARLDLAPAGRAEIELWRDDPWALGVCAGSRDGRRWLVGGYGGQVHVLAWDGERLAPTPTRQRRPLIPLDPSRP